MKQQTSLEPKQIEASKLGLFFTDQLKDIYWAEQHLVKTLPKMQAAATTDKLQDAFEDHQRQTRQHVIRLERVFDLLNLPREGEKCPAMAGITEEGQNIIEETEESTMTRDAALILAAQKVEHYEIATYGGLLQLARCLDIPEVADILEQTLREEKEADTLLTEIAFNNVNHDACMEMS